jgi:hypothetical protein
MSSFLVISSLLVNEDGVNLAGTSILSAADSIVSDGICNVNEVEVFWNMRWKRMNREFSINVENSCH